MGGTDSTEPAVLIDVDARGVASVTLNRPRVNNAYDGAMIEGLLNGIGKLGADAGVRLIVLRGNGRVFQAGADLAWLAEVAGRSEEENLRVSRNTTDAVRFLDACPKPTLALVHGGCYGGGVGMISACDVVVASGETRFSISEVRWGLVAGPIIPQLGAAMGPRQLRRYALTGERFDAARAREIGLIHDACATGELEAAAAPIIDAVLSNGPEAVADTKRTIMDTAGLKVSDDLAHRLAEAHARKRRTEEAAEGLASFREKRPAKWYPG